MCEHIQDDGGTLAIYLSNACCYSHIVPSTIFWYLESVELETPFSRIVVTACGSLTEEKFIKVCKTHLLQSLRIMQANVNNDVRSENEKPVVYNYYLFSFFVIYYYFSLNKSKDCSVTFTIILINTFLLVFFIHGFKKLKISKIQTTIKLNFNMI